MNSCERVCNQWDDDNIALVLDDIRHLKDVEDLDNLMQMIWGIYVCRGQYLHL